MLQFVSKYFQNKLGSRYTLSPNRKTFNYENIILLNNMLDLGWGQP